MAAPAAPVIDYRASTAGSLRIRWAAVTGAATYNVYRESVLVASTSGLQAVVPCSVGEAIVVKSLNVGLEESGASNTVTVGGMGSNTSFPPTGPRGPYRLPFG